MVKNKLGSITEKLTKRHLGREQKSRFDVNQNNCENKICESTQLLQLKKEAIVWSTGISGSLLQLFIVFGFNIAQ